MAKNKVLTEKTDINTPFSEFVRKFKKQKTAMVAMVFLVFLVVLAFISYKIALTASMNMITLPLCSRLRPPIFSAPMSSAGICFPG